MTYYWDGDREHTTRRREGHKAGRGGRSHTAVCRPWGRPLDTCSAAGGPGRRPRCAAPVGGGRAGIGQARAGRRRPKCRPCCLALLRRKLELDLLAGELFVDGGECVDLVLDVGRL